MKTFSTWKVAVSCLALTLATAWIVRSLLESKAPKALTRQAPKPPKTLGLSLHKVAELTEEFKSLPSQFNQARIEWFIRVAELAERNPQEALELAKTVHPETLAKALIQLCALSWWKQDAKGCLTGLKAVSNNVFVTGMSAIAYHEFAENAVASLHWIQSQQIDLDEVNPLVERWLAADFDRVADELVKSHLPREAVRTLSEALQDQPEKALSFFKRHADYSSIESISFGFPLCIKRPENEKYVEEVLAILTDPQERENYVTSWAFALENRDPSKAKALLDKYSSTTPNPRLPYILSKLHPNNPDQLLAALNRLEGPEAESIKRKALAAYKPTVPEETWLPTIDEPGLSWVAERDRKATSTSFPEIELNSILKEPSLLRRSRLLESFLGDRTNLESPFDDTSTFTEEQRRRYYEALQLIRSRLPKR